MSYCLTATCLAHRERVFWQHTWSCWVHSAGCHPCDSLVFEPDPVELLCRYCGVRLDADGASRLWALVPEADRRSHWEKWTEYAWQPPREKYRWRDDAWTDKCPVSPTFLHHVGPLRFT